MKSSRVERARFLRQDVNRGACIRGAAKLLVGASNRRVMVCALTEWCMERESAGAPLPRSPEVLRAAFMEGLPR